MSIPCVNRKRVCIFALTTVFTNTHTPIRHGVTWEWSWSYHWHFFSPLLPTGQTTESLPPFLVNLRGPFCEMLFLCVKYVTGLAVISLCKPHPHRAEQTDRHWRAFGSIHLDGLSGFRPFCRWVKYVGHSEVAFAFWYLGQKECWRKYGEQRADHFHIFWGLLRFKHTGRSQDITRR